MQHQPHRRGQLCLDGPFHPPQPGDLPEQRRPRRREPHRRPGPLRIPHGFAPAARVALAPGAGYPYAQRPLRRGAVPLRQRGSPAGPPRAHLRDRRPGPHHRPRRNRKDIAPRDHAAGPLASPDGPHTLHLRRLRHPRPGQAGQGPQGHRSAPPPDREHDGGESRRTARQGRHHRPRSVQRTGRASRHLPRRQGLPAGHAEPRVRAYRHQLPQDRLQQRLRLLHRGPQHLPRPGAAGVDTQADACGV